MITCVLVYTKERWFAKPSCRDPLVFTGGITERFTFSNCCDMKKGGDDMSKEYIFEFSGTKEDLLNSVERFSHKDTYSGNTFYYFDDYIVKLVGDEIHFGVARGGHSGGYWFVPTITESDDGLELRGEIRYVGPKVNRGPVKKAIDRVGDFLLFLFVLPIVLVVRAYVFLKWLVRKISNRPVPKEKTNEERLFELMENYFSCVASITE